jgi:hypothetical protein
MKILTEGHKYVAANFENNEEGQTIQFIEKTGAPGEVLTTINDGTTNEEVLEILINRLNFLNAKFPCRENALAITNMEQALMWLEKRTKDRLKRDVEGKQIK